MNTNSDGKWTWNVLFAGDGGMPGGPGVQGNEQNQYWSQFGYGSHAHTAIIRQPTWDTPVTFGIAEFASNWSIDHITDATAISEANKLINKWDITPYNTI